MRREQRSLLKASYGEVADHLLRAHDLGSREEAEEEDPLLGELAGLAEDDRNVLMTRPTTRASPALGD